MAQRYKTARFYKASEEKKEENFNSLVSFWKIVITAGYGLETLFLERERELSVTVIESE